MPNTLSPQKTSLFGALNALADEIQAEKTAAARVKQAGPTPSDPGGYQGPTSHPVKNVDNNVQDATEGARSTENEKDVKEDQGKPSVNSAPEAKPGQSQDNQIQVGTKKAPTGEDPSSEDDYKGTKDDPGTSHPATTEDGEKYGSATFKEAHDRSTGLANDILADLANGFGSQLVKGQKQAAAQPAAPAATPSTPNLLQQAAQVVKQGAANPTDAAVQAGYELATALGIEKQAAVASVQACIDQTIRDAHIDADLLGGYLTTFNKQAADDMDDSEGGEDHSVAGDEATGASDAPPDGGMGGAGGGGLDALLGGGGADMGGGGADMGGGAPGGPDDIGTEPSKEEALQELVAALDELGIPIEALAQAGGGDAGAGAPPPGGDMGGAPPAGAAPDMGGGAPPVGEGMKLAQAIQRFKLSGKYQIKEASTKRARHIRDVMKAHVREVMGLK